MTSEVLGLCVRLERWPGGRHAIDLVPIGKVAIPWTATLHTDLPVEVGDWAVFRWNSNGTPDVLRILTATQPALHSWHVQQAAAEKINRLRDELLRIRGVARKAYLKGHNCVTSDWLIATIQAALHEPETTDVSGEALTSDQKPEQD